MSEQNTLKSGASFHRGKSNQTFATPPEFRSAIVKQFGFPCWDLAASAENFFGPPGKYFDEKNSAFIHDWHRLDGILWLNPPFADIAPWAEKCAAASKQGARILLLVPASVGAKWFQDHVHNCAAHVYFLAPRICFDGKGPFPKDCLLADYSGLSFSTYYRCWRWK